MSKSSSKHPLKKTISFTSKALFDIKKALNLNAISTTFFDSLILLLLLPTKFPVKTNLSFGLLLSNICLQIFSNGSALPLTDPITHTLSNEPKLCILILLSDIFFS